MPAFEVVRPGMLTTIQDLGRWGHQSNGVPVAGPMDEYSHRLANRLVRNPDGAAALEVTLMGPELRASGAVTCAVAGASFDLTVDGQAVAMHEPFVIPDGARLRFGARRAGARAMLAVQGGIHCEALFGSRATSLVSRLGPLNGRPLAAGNRIDIGPGDAVPDGHPGRPMSMPDGGARVRVMLGPQDDRFVSEALDLLRRARYLVTPESNRMGYRLDGPRLLHRDGADMLSDATPIGSLQVPGSGHPILLMADRQTTGGYPKIATVISADLPVAGQLAPGDWIEFAPCSRSAAIEALAERRASLGAPAR